MRSQILSTTIVLAAPICAGAQSFDGTFQQNLKSDCELVGVDGGALKVENGVFFGVESQCKMQNPVDVRGMEAVLYDMSCTGEGAEWTARAMFMTAADDGLIMIWDGFAFLYDRCPDHDSIETDAADDTLDEGGN